MDHGENFRTRAGAVPRLMLTVAETHSRSAAGGYLYLVGWGALTVAAGLNASHLHAVIAFAVLFLAIAWLRHRMSPPGDARATPGWMVRYICVVLSSALLWGIVQMWVLLDTHVEKDVKYVSLVGTIAYATVFSHLYATSLRLAGGGVALMMVPTLAILWGDPHLRVMAATLSLYTVYLFVAAIRSHRDYQRQLDLHEELSRQRDLYEHLSRTDPLTGLFNRRHFTAVLEQWTRSSTRDAQPVSLLLIDIDHFKSINDRHGHVAGDLTLKAIADLMQRTCGAPDRVLARVGGEEFAILMKGLDDANVRALAEQFQRTLAKPVVVIEGMQLIVSVSIGAGHFDAAQHDDEGDFFRVVDSALYVAKAEGRNRTRFADRRGCIS